MTAPSVTVAVCTWNRANLLDQTLARMRELRVPAGMTWEVLIVNNNCTDATDRVIDRHRPHLPLNRVFEPKPGLSFARNSALTAAKSEYLLWTDDDVLVDPEWVTATVAAFEVSKADLVFGRVLPWWEDGHPPSWYTPLFDGMFALLDLGPESVVVRDRDRTGFGVNHSFRTDSLRRLGGYRTDLGVVEGKGGGGEDLDIFHRAHDAGMTVAYTPGAIVRHYIPSQRCTKSFYRRYTRGGTSHHLRMLREQARKVPSVAGLPRYFLRANLVYFGRYLGACARREVGTAFFYELKLRRLGGLVWSLLREQPGAGRGSS